MLIISTYTDGDKLRILDSFTVEYPDKPHIIHKNQINDVIIKKFDNGVSFIDDSNSCTIEFITPKLRSDNSLKAGRIYFDKQKFDATGEIVLKDEKFLLMGEKLIKWVKSNFKNAKISPTWATLRVAEWVNSTNAKLIE